MYVNNNSYLRIHGQLSIKPAEICVVFKISRGDFSYEGDGSLPLDSYKPSQEKLARSFITNKTENITLL